MNMARCLLFEKKMPKVFWAEAVNTAVYLLNKLSTKALDRKTAFEAWKGYKPSIDHLRVFGSIFYTHVPAVNRSKLDARAVEGLLICYSDVTKGYRNLQTKKVVISRDVKVEEKLSWNWEKKTVDSEDDHILVDEIPDNEENEELDPKSFDHTPIRGTRSLQDVYNRCYMAVLEPVDVDEALKVDVWRKAMQGEIDMINKNATWVLMKKPDDKEGHWCQMDIQNQTE